MIQRVCAVALLLVALAACEPTYPTGAIPDRKAALAFAMHLCGDRFAKFPAPIVELQGDTWHVYALQGGASAEVTVNARTGKHWSCRVTSDGVM